MLERRSLASNDDLPDGECTTTDDCAGRGMTSPKCVNQTGGGWTQCIDCESKAFQSACGYWTDKVLLPAEKACRRNCTHKVRCTKDADCEASTPDCVIQDKDWSQCISCDANQFQK